MKNRFWSLILVCVILINAVCAVSAFGAHKAGAWAQNSIDIANTYGIISPEVYSGDYTVAVTRRAVAEMVVNAYENIHGTIQYVRFPFLDTYGDVNVDKVCTLGIMNGRNDEIFSPYDNVTREEMAKIILELKSAVECRDLSLPSNPQVGFYDFALVSDWAKPYVAYAKSIGIFSGYDDNTFRSKESVSVEMAIVLILRCSQFNVKSKPSITSITDGSVVSSDADLNVGISAVGPCRLYVCKAEANSDPILVECFNSGATISSNIFEKNSAYALFAECDGVFSDVVNIYTDAVNLNFNVIGRNSNGMYRISWNRMGGVDVYVIKITERRNSYYKDDIPANAPVVYALRWEDYIDVYFNPDRTYTIEISGGPFYDITEINVPEVQPEGASQIKAGYPTTKEEADALVTSIQVPVWKIQNGEKVSSVAYLTVHNRIADKVKLVFEEIYNGPEKFPIKDVGGYAWRGGRSEHNGGTAIDINANENYCIYNDGTVIGSYWRPYSDVYSITPYGDVVRAFEKYGFTWGGDSWRNPRDYMHFSYLGT